MKKHLLLFCFILTSLTVSAETVEIDGIYYNLYSYNNSAVVTSNPNKYRGDICIPSTVTYETVIYDVINISSNAFRYNKELTSISIPPSIYYIQQDAFQGCTGMTAVYISDLSAWCNITFEGSPYGWTNPLSMAHHLFLNGEEIKELVIPNDITIIKPYTFFGCEGITSVTIPSSIVEIYDYAFFECSNLKEVQIEDLSAWCNISFSQNNVYNLNSNPLRIAQHLFLNGEEITNLELPDGIDMVKNYTFYGCVGLTSVTIPSSVTSIGSSAFYGCVGLTSVSIPSSVTTIGNSAFYGCTLLNSLNIPNGVLSVGENAFNSCISMSFVTIPNSVTLIDNMAFYGCKGLATITIGDGINYIESNAFGNCLNLLDVYNYAEKVPSTVTNAFEGSNYEYANLHVPSGSVNFYKEVEPWKNFKEIVAIDGDFIDATQISNKDVLIQSADGILTIRGLDNATKVNVYNPAGILIGSATGKNGQAMINTNQLTGSIAIVKIGDKAVKFMVK